MRSKNIYPIKVSLFKIVTVMIFFFVIQPAIAQTGVLISGSAGTAVPSAMLEVRSSNKGLLLPNVTLGSLTDATSPVNGPVAGLFVYNTGGANPVGLYYWNGATNAWVQLTTGGFSGTGVANFLARWTTPTNLGTGVTYDNGTNVGIGTTSPSAKLHISAGDASLALFGPNATWGGKLYVGASTNQAVALTAQVIATDGNLHLDPAPSKNMYLGFYQARDIYINPSGANVGIGNTAPGEKLDVSGNIKATGIVYWGNSLSRTESRDNAGLRGDAGARSGFFETSVPSPAANWYQGASSWQHLLDIRHNNPANNFAMQFAGSFFDQNLYFRKTNDNAAQPWSRIVTTTEGGNATVFNYTGGDQSYTVPTGVTTITVKMWGAGGGGGYFGGWTIGWSGGAGGFTQGTIAVTSGQVLTVVVGGGGVGAFQYNNTTTSSYGGGASACNAGGTDCRYGGQGGGRSAIRNGGTELMTAGGGGGGGACRNSALAQYGGAGGGTLGQDGTSDQVHWCKGIGGSQTVGGSGGNCGSVGSAGTQFAGGRAGPATQGYGGGGGGGWFGGGGGSYEESNSMAGGGGGSGYIGGAGVSNAITICGDRTQPPKKEDLYYSNGIGMGGITYGTSAAGNGGNGKVVILY